MVIYLIRNKVNNKIYIGKSVDFGLRWRYGHLFDVKNQSQTLLHRAIRKYGESSFDFQFLATGIGTKEEANELERYWISFLGAANSEVGYNMTPGGDGGATITGRKRPEHSRLMKERLSGKYPAQLLKVPRWNKGKNLAWNKGKKSTALGVCYMCFSVITKSCKSANQVFCSYRCSGAHRKHVPI